MKRWKVILLWCTLPSVLLWGCGRDNAGVQKDAAEWQSIMGGSKEPASDGQDTAAAESFFSGELLEESPWQDNTLDDYIAVGHYPLLPRQPEGEMGGIWEYAMGSTCGAVFKKHFFESAEENWEELKIVTDQGDENSVRLAFRENAVNQAWGIGGIIGSDHFILLDMDVPGETDSRWRYRLNEIDENQQIVRTVHLEFLDGDGEETPDRIMVDRAGNIHFTTGCGKYYFVADSEGKLLEKYNYSGTDVRLIALYDGRVALRSVLVDDEGRGICSRLEYADIGTGKMELLAELDENAPKVFLNGAYYTMWDERTLLYADSKGLHFADFSGNSTGDVYVWSNHGISFLELEELRIQEDGGISLIYSNSQREGNLLFLKPAGEKVEIKQIVLAVSPYMRDVYYPAVVEFNKKYPAYHIALKTDYDRTRLLTELTAGKGPVLVDTMLTGFEDHEELWMSLEGLFDGEKWEDVLIPQAMEMGKIDDTLCGVVSNFGIRTVVIAEKEPTEWDYESFLDGIENKPSLEAVFNGQNNVWSFMATFLINGMEDNYLLDADSGATYFDSDRFRRALRLGITYCNENEYVEAGTLSPEGKVFCNAIFVTRPELIDLYRICYGRDANYIGFPSQDGSAHYIDSNCLLTIRATASEEEKRIAGAFLRILLSREMQLEGAKDSNFWLSVRRDVLEEQIRQVNEMSMPSTYGFDQIILGDDYDREYDARLLDRLLENARPKRYFPKELNNIMMEEIEEYIGGVITEEVLIERLTKRAELYLAEKL